MFYFSIMSSSRVLRSVQNEKYYSPDNVAEVIKSLCVLNTGYVDPCAGKNHLFRILPDPKVRYDIEDGNDFFDLSRADFKMPRITFVMNPPFTLPGQQNGVIKFLNHASKQMVAGEYIICVAPQTMRKWTNIHKVDEKLHLEEEHIFHKSCVYMNKGKKKKVATVIQVWKYCEERAERPLLLRSHDDFYARYTEKADFFICVWGVVEKIGKISTEVPSFDGKKYHTQVGTICSTGKGGTAIGIKVLGNKSTVLKRFREMFDTKEWLEFAKYKCAGSNNPHIVSKQIYTLYEKGIKYLKKESYGVKILIV